MRNKYKIVFLGNAAVGKTTLISQIVYKVAEDCYNPTIGIDFLTTQLKIKDKKVRLQLWDTAGQERFNSIIPNYTRDCFLAVIVFDLTDLASSEAINHWIEDLVRINDPQKNVKILIVGNKIDLFVQKIRNEFKHLDESPIETQANSIKANSNIYTLSDSQQRTNIECLNTIGQIKKEITNSENQAKIEFLDTTKESQEENSNSENKADTQCFDTTKHTKNRTSNPENQVNIERLDKNQYSQKGNSNSVNRENPSVRTKFNEIKSEITSKNISEPDTLQEKHIYSNQDPGKDSDIAKTQDDSDIISQNIRLKSKTDKSVCLSEKEQNIQETEKSLQKKDTKDPFGQHSLSLNSQNKINSDKLQLESPSNENTTNIKNQSIKINIFQDTNESQRSPSANIEKSRVVCENSIQGNGGLDKISDLEKKDDSYKDKNINAHFSLANSDVLNICKKFEIYDFSNNHLNEKNGYMKKPGESQSIKKDNIKRNLVAQLGQYISENVAIARKNAVYNKGSFVICSALSTEGLQPILDVIYGLIEADMETSANLIEISSQKIILSDEDQNKKRCC